jgi:hypothetical protein
VDATTWTNAVDHPFFITFDLAMGGGNTGCAMNDVGSSRD